MTESHSDALVFFGATGDLAYKKIVPALPSMIKRGMTVMDPEEKMIGAPTELSSLHHPEVEMDAYERLLEDAMAGDASLFAREDYVEENWRIVDAVLKAEAPVNEYDEGAWGPPEAQRLAPPGGWQAPMATPQDSRP